MSAKGCPLDVPEFAFTHEQLEQLTRLLGFHWADLNKLIQEELSNAGPWFVQELTYHRQPSPSQIDRSLKRIESSAVRLSHDISRDDFALSQIRIAAFGDDPTPEEALVAVQKFRKWASDAREIIRKQATPSGKAKKGAMRVLVQRLGNVWLHAHGTRPTYSVSRQGKAGGPFIKFALQYVATMRNQTTDEYLKRELRVSPDAIAWHLKVFLKRLGPRGKVESLQK